MKSRKYKNRPFILIPAFLLATTMVFSQTYEKSSKEVRSFYAGPETEIQISNKYGNIHLVPWEKDSVTFEIDLSVKAGKEQKVDKLFSNIAFDFTDTKYYVIARTTFKETSIFTDISDMANALFSSGSNVQINYLVHFPEKSRIKIDNKFGNIYSTDHYGDLDINLSNGDLKLNKTLGKTKIIVEFGNVTINSIESGELTINYGELELKNGSEIVLNSKSSRLTITDVGSLNITSHRDKYFIDAANSIKGDLSFSYLNVKKLQRESVIKTSYGTINLQSVANDFKFINLNSEYTDIQLFFDTTASYNLEILHSGKTSLSLMPGLISVQKELVSKGDDLFRTYGLGGKNGENLPTVKISIRAGSVSIIHQ